MNIVHRPIVDVEKAAKLYSEKDGVDVTYVCTSALGNEAQAMDIFYRATPHPEFGNRYFGLFWVPGRGRKMELRITSADRIESVDFSMVQVNDGWHYSQHRHDFYTVGNISIDGGRAYFRIVGDFKYPRMDFVIKDGLFVEKEHDDLNL